MLRDRPDDRFTRRAGQIGCLAYAPCDGDGIDLDPEPWIRQPGDDTHADRRQIGHVSVRVGQGGKALVDRLPVPVARRASRAKVPWPLLMTRTTAATACWR